MIEFALMASVAILLLFAIIDLGRVVSIHTVMGAAAQAAARKGAIAEGNVDVVAFAHSRMTSFDSGAVQVDVTQTPDYTEVRMNYDFHPLTPFVTQVLGQNGLNVSTAARVYKLGSAYVASLGNGEGGRGATATPAPTSTSEPDEDGPAPTPTPTWTNTPLAPTVTATPRPPTSTPVSPTATPSPTVSPCV